MTGRPIRQPRDPDHQRDTKAAYDNDADGWTARTEARRVEDAVALATRVDGPVLDLGCGPGWHLGHLGPGSIGVDLSLPMARLARPHGPVAQADMTALPFANQSLAGVWASRSIVHFPRTEVPLILAELHRTMRVGGEAYLWLFEGDHERVRWRDDSLPGRTFSYWPLDLLQRVIVGAGFLADYETWEAERGVGQIIVRARRQWSLPDYVGPGMKLLICGLNPSPASADSSIGFGRPGNRFWPAALEAGLVSRARDPSHALKHHGVGMTDLVKRTTRRANELSADEYRHGIERVDQLVRWLQPDAVCMVGLAGWRAAVDRKAERGWQPEPLGGRPVYLMPSTSGLNAHDTVDSLADHLRTAGGGGRKGDITTRSPTLD